MVEVIETDVLVIGGGGAAARAALEAHQAGAKVTLAVKGDFGITGIRGSGATGGGRADMFGYFCTPGKTAKHADEDEIIFKRMIQAGLGMADKRLVRVLVDDALETRSALEKWGLVLRLMPFETRKTVRALIIPMPGLACVVRGISEIVVRERMMVTDLLIRDGACVGAIGIDEDCGELFLLKAGATILATGGNSQLFMFNLHPSCITGDGYRMGYEAGAELMNMEFHQMFTAMVYPTVTTLDYYTNWGACPKVRNVNGDEFIQHYLPQEVTLEECMKQKTRHHPYSTRDASKYLEIALIKETKARRANEHTAFYLDAVHPKAIPQRVQQWLDYRGMDWSKDYVEINVVHHCSNGGFRINENGQTTILGLYAVGETATGAYGADRLGGAMQAFSQVFGVRAGKHAAATAKARDLPPVDDQTAESQLQRIADLKKSRGDQKPFELMKMLKKTAWENLLAVRSRESLTQFLQEMKRICNDLVPRLYIENTPVLVEALELESLLKVGEIVANVALMRTESRGSHYRDDFPNRDDANWLQSITVKKTAGKMQLSTLKLDEEWKDKPDDLGEARWG